MARSANRKSRRSDATNAFFASPSIQAIGHGGRTPLKHLRDRVLTLESQLRALQVENANLQAEVRGVRQAAVLLQVEKESVQPPQRDTLAELTERERQVVRLFSKYPNDNAIARQLGLRPQTVRNHIASAKRKLGISAREELIVWVLSHAGVDLKQSG
jgi:DNA-binding NarL/FixJ family response regulator